MGPVYKYTRGNILLDYLAMATNAASTRGNMVSSIGPEYHVPYDGLSTVSVYSVAISVFLYRVPITPLYYDLTLPKPFQFE